MHPISKIAVKMAIAVAIAYISVKAIVVAYLTWPLDLRGNLTIAPGETAVSVVESLADQFNVPSPRILLTLLKWRGLDKKITAGTISLDGVKNISQLISRLGNPSYNDTEITVIEGWTIRDIQAYGKVKGMKALESIDVVTGPSAYDYRKPTQQLPSFTDQFPFLKSKPSAASLEGYLFPDTYRIDKSATADDIVKIMLNNFAVRIDEKMRSDIAAQGKSLHDVVVMASVIEREVQSPEDMAIVADIFWRRLALGMPLQADSTVNYVIGGDKPSITLDQTKLDSPYNTYKYTGLPLGPIGNPGLNAIRAAVYPQKNTFLYFLTDSEGLVHYASTFEGHIKNRQLYLR